MRNSYLTACLGAILVSFTTAAPTTEIGAYLGSSADYVALQTRQGDCRRTLSCSYGYIEQQPYQWRRDYLSNMQSGYLNPYNSGTQFRGLDGLLALVIDIRLGAAGTWYSGINAGLIEAIQNAVAIVVGISSRDGGNPGVRLWVAFFRRMRSGGYASNNEHDFAWSQCEETSSEYGRQISERRYRPTYRENICYKGNQAYRYYMRNKVSALATIRLSLRVDNVLNGLVSLVGSLGGQLNLSINLLAWLTNVNDGQSCYSYYSACNRYLDGQTSNQPPDQILRRIMPGLLQSYDDTQGK